MIPIEKEIQIRLMLKKGLSTRMIAREIGVARQTVETIKSLPRLRRRRKPCTILPKNRPRKCSTCGGMVKIWPCLLCHPEIGDYDEK